jgi:isopenicillin-N epimerase
MIGSIAVVPMPVHAPDSIETKLIPPLQNALFERFGIEVPVIYRTAAPKQLIRISAQMYNTREQYEYLARALIELLAG